MRTRWGFMFRIVFDWSCSRGTEPQGNSWAWLVAAGCRLFAPSYPPWQLCYTEGCRFGATQTQRWPAGEGARI